ncbi:hypothetical protein AB1N83_011579 [Pleurotus pulmonarius]
MIDYRLILCNLSCRRRDEPATVINRNVLRFPPEHGPSNILYETKTWNVDDLNDKIQASPSAFARFEVVRITHIKDLANWVWHEYIQVIVRDSTTSSLLRLIAERQTDNDHVIIGMWKAWKEGDIPPDGSGDTKLPLALFTLEFNNSPVPLKRFVEVLCAVRSVEPEYTVYAANCYWYALAVYTSLYALYKKTASERKWAWWFYRYLPPTYIAWWDMVTVPLMRIAASQFKVDDMKDKGASKIIRSTTVQLRPKPDPRVVNFWLAIQHEMVTRESDVLDIPILRFRNNTLTAEQIEANLLNTKGFSGKPNPALGHPDGDTQRTYQFTDQVQDIYKNILQDPLLDTYINKANELGFDRVFTPLKANNIPPECKEMLDEMGPGWRLTERHCKDLNTSIKACVGAVEMRVGQ